MVILSCYHTVRHTTFGRTPLDEGSARRRYLYLRTHNNNKRQTSMPPKGFELAVPARVLLRPRGRWHRRKVKFFKYLNYIKS
jgi:hypothetical protein